MHIFCFLPPASLQPGEMSFWKLVESQFPPGGGMGWGGGGGDGSARVEILFVKSLSAEKFRCQRLSGASNPPGFAQVFPGPGFGVGAWNRTHARARARARQAQGPPRPATGAEWGEGTIPLCPGLPWRGNQSEKELSNWEFFFSVCGGVSRFVCAPEGLQLTHWGGALCWAAQGRGLWGVGC